MPRIAGTLLIVGLTCAASRGQVNIPEGFEVVELDRTDLHIEFPQINNCGQIVVQHGVEGDRAEVFLYDNGSAVAFTNNSRPNRWNGLPDINDAGTIAWSRFDHNSFGPEEVFVYRDGKVSRLAAGGNARINNLEHIVWEKNRRDNGCHLLYDIMFYDGDSIRRIFRSRLTDQGPEINDLDQITWGHADFCVGPWEGDILLYSKGDIVRLPTEEKQVQGPSINNVPQVVWRAVTGVEFWEDGKTVLLAEKAYVPAINNLGDVYFVRGDRARDARQPWLYRVSGGEPTFHRLADDDRNSGRGETNDWGEVAWRDSDKRSITDGLRLMRRIRTGDSEFDGDIDPVDYAAFADCMTGPGRVDRLCDCRFLDIDYDGDVDLGDFALFQKEFTGP